MSKGQEAKRLHFVSKSLTCGYENVRNSLMFSQTRGHTEIIDKYEKRLEKVMADL